MSKKNKQKDYDLKDFIWEEEEFTFNPKENRHGKFLHAKKRQLEKEAHVNFNKQFFDTLYRDEHGRYISKIEQSLLSDYYDMEDDEDFVEYRIK